MIRPTFTALNTLAIAQKDAGFLQNKSSFNATAVQMSLYDGQNGSEVGLSDFLCQSSLNKYFISTYQCPRYGWYKQPASMLSPQFSAGDSPLTWYL
jgi:hypothetical protein